MEEEDVNIEDDGNALIDRLQKLQEVIKKLRAITNIQDRAIVIIKTNNYAKKMEIEALENDIKNIINNLGLRKDDENMIIDAWKMDKYLTAKHQEDSFFSTYNALVTFKKLQDSVIETVSNITTYGSKYFLRSSQPETQSETSGITTSLPTPMK